MKFPLKVDAIEVGSPPASDAVVPSLRQAKKTIPSLGPNEVLVRILCTGICHTDFYLFNEIGAVPGHEGVGIVEAVGSSLLSASRGDSIVKPGDRVGVGFGTGSCGLTTCRECADGHETTCNEFASFLGGKRGFLTRRGEPKPISTYSRYVSRDALFVFPIPEGLPSPYAGPLVCAGATVYSAIAEAAECLALRPGGTVGVSGIGGLGHLAIKFAKAMGYNVVALTRSTSKVEMAKELGADRVVITSDDKSMEDAERSIDLLLNTVAGNIDWGKYMALVGPRGRAVVIGNGTEPNKIPGPSLQIGNKSVAGNLVAGSRHMKDMLKLAAKKNVYPWIECYPMTPEGAERAITSVADGSVRFRAVLVAEDCDVVPESKNLL